MITTGTRPIVDKLVGLETFLPNRSVGEGPSIYSFAAATARELTGKDEITAAEFGDAVERALAEASKPPPAEPGPLAQLLDALNEAITRTAVDYIELYIPQILELVLPADFLAEVWAYYAGAFSEERKDALGLYYAEAERIADVITESCLAAGLTDGEAGREHRAINPSYAGSQIEENGGVALHLFASSFVIPRIALRTPLGLLTAYRGPVVPTALAALIERLTLTERSPIYKHPLHDASDRIFSVGRTATGEQLPPFIERNPAHYVRPHTAWAVWREVKPESRQELDRDTW